MKTTRLMKGLALGLAGLAGLCVMPAAAQEAGAGISVFVPSTLIRNGSGSIAFEQGLSTSIGLGSTLSVPMGFVYHGADGWRLEDAAFTDNGKAALHGDILMPYVGLQAKLPLGAGFFIQAHAAAAGSYAFRLESSGQELAAGLAGAGETVAIKSLGIGKKIGYGYLAGGAIGITIAQVSVVLGAEWRSIRQPAPLSGEIYRVTGAAASLETLSLPNAKALLEGVAFKLGGSFKF
ncbi:MAG: hypothetical protein JNG85_09830 [Spirochaetaceae bacterium]|nr:hypothetical protein [Spirochaetaceae bacterium]